jgi:biotin transport system substrate-specific component
VSTLAIAAAPIRIRGALIYRMALALAGSWLVAGLAQLQIRLPFTPVPVTGQTLGVLLVGASLGSALGSMSMVLYLAQGAIGLPFFAGGTSGFDLLSTSSATGGYLLGFVAAAAAVGALAEHGWDRDLRGSISAMFLGELVLYLVAIPWLMQALDIGLERALILGLAPFIVGDALKLLVAAGALPAAWRLVRPRSEGTRRRRDDAGR